MSNDSPFRYPVGAAERMARRLYCLAMRRFMPIIMSAQGARFLVDVTDYIDRCIAFDGIWDGPQLDRLAGACSARRIDLFLDVGAHCGFYSVMFATKNLADRVMAFEPDPGNYAHLMANLYLNDLAGRVAARPVALGEQAGEATLYEGAKWNRGESTIAIPEQTPRAVTHRVRQERLDDECRLAGQSIVIKLDVEGYEFQALAGMHHLLTDNACYVQVELYSDRLADLKALFARLGYRFLSSEYIDHFFTNTADLA